MLTDKQVKDFERQLTSLADVYYNSRNGEVKERNRGYCQGMAYVLAALGYVVAWDNGKAYIVKDD